MRFAASRPRSASINRSSSSRNVAVSSLRRDRPAMPAPSFDVVRARPEVKRRQRPASMSEAFAHQHAALGADGGLPGRAPEVATRADDVAFQARMSFYGDHEPFEADGFVGVDRPAEAEVKIDTDHGGPARKMRGGERHQMPGGLRAAGNRTAVTRAPGIVRIVMHGVEVAGGAGVAARRLGGERDRRGKALVGAGHHAARSLWPSWPTIRRSRIAPGAAARASLTRA